MGLVFEPKNAPNVSHLNNRISETELEQNTNSLSKKEQFNLNLSDKNQHVNAIEQSQNNQALEFSRSDSDLNKQNESDSNVSQVVRCLCLKTIILPALLSLSIIWLPAYFEWKQINILRSEQIRQTAIHNCNKTENQSLFYLNDCGDRTHCTAYPNIYKTNDL